MIHRAFARASAALCAATLLAGMTPAEAPVADAAMRGDVETVRTLLREGADVNEAQGDGMTDRKSTRLNSSHSQQSRMPSSA